MAVDRGINQGSVVIYDLENVSVIRSFIIPMQPSDIVATDSGLNIVAGDAGVSTVIGVYDGNGNQAGYSVGVWPQMRLALHPSQNVIYGVDMFPPNYYHFALSAAGVITNQWQVPISAQEWVTDLFALPNGARMLNSPGEFLTSTTDLQTDLKPAGPLDLAPIISTAYITNQNVLIAASPQEVRYYNYETNQLLERRSVPGAAYVGTHGERTAVLLRDAFAVSQSEIRFLFPKATSAAENRPPAAVIEIFADSVLPVDSLLSVRTQGRDADGEIQSLSLFSGTNRVYSTGADEAYVNVTVRAGTNDIYAVVEDAFGATTTSRVIRVFGNHTPVVQVTPMQTVYPSVQPVTIRATASDPDGEVKFVSLLLSGETIEMDSSAPYEFEFTPPFPGTYSLQVQAEDNLGGTGNSQVLTLIFEGATDNFGPGIPLVPGTNFTLTGSTVNATRQKGEPLHVGEAGGKSVWWSWRVPTSIAPNGGTLSIDTFGSDFDTLLAVYSGGPQGTNDITKLKLLAANDDDITFAPASRVKFFVPASNLLYIAIDGREGVAGTAKLRLSFAPAPVNDSFRAPAATSAFGTLTGSNIGATHEPGEPAHAGNSGGASVWWRVQLGAGVPVQVSTANSTFDTLLAIYTTNLPSHLPPAGFTNLTLVAANDDASFNTRYSGLIFLPPKTGTYWIAVDGYDGAQGRITLSISSMSAHLNLNDQFGEAVPLSGISILTTGYNHFATISPGEPLHAGKTNSGSLWYRWTAPTNGLVSISTRTSEFDTVLAVYTGTNFASLQLVAANDDDPANPPASAVIFHAMAGTVYRIAVAGYGNARGEFTLALNQTPGYTPRLLSQWAQGKLWLNTTNTFGTTLLEGSTNLVNWQIVQTIGGAQSVEITPLANRSQQFYRLRLVE